MGSGEDLLGPHGTDVSQEPGKVKPPANSENIREARGNMGETWAENGKCRGVITP